jgi:hypothetical protein
MHSPLTSQKSSQSQLPINFQPLRNHCGGPLVKSSTNSIHRPFLVDGMGVLHECDDLIERAKLPELRTNFKHARIRQEYTVNDVPIPIVQLT